MDIYIRHVYFMQNEATKNIKIGSSLHPSRRKADIKHDEKSPVRILHVYVGGGAEKESEFQKMFEDINVFREWFKPEDKLLEFINLLKRNRLIWISNNNREEESILLAKNRTKKVGRPKMPKGHKRKSMIFRLPPDVVYFLDNSVANKTEAVVHALRKTFNINILK